MNKIFFRTILVLVLLAAIAGLGAFAFQAGIAQGIAQSAQLQHGELPAPVYPYHGMWYGGGPFFGFLGCLGPLFLFFLVFAALRGLFWHGRGWGHHPHGTWGPRDWPEGVPPKVEEWHRKMHESGAPPAGAQPPTEQV